MTPFPQVRRYIKVRGDALRCEGMRFVTFLSRKKSNQKKALTSRVNGFLTKVHSVIKSKVKL